MTTVPETRIGGFAEPEVFAVLETACRHAGVDASDAKLLRGHTNAVYLLESAGAVVKIARAGTPVDDVRRTVALVQWLMAMKFPTVELLPVEQPVLVGPHAVTFWRHLPQPRQAVPAAHLADPLRTLHQLPLPPFEIRSLDTVAAIRRSIGVAAALPGSDLDFLGAHVSELEAGLARVRYLLEPGLLQGDPQHRNALHSNDAAVLCDWDTACFGPPELDLVTVEIHCRRFGYGRSHYEEFADRYGFDVTAWDGYPVLRDLRELRMVTTNAKRAPAGSETLAEVRRRIVGIRESDAEMRWNIL
ncbi:phosphotransferase family protein [Kitasatospora sp. NRRL B-11411]|uniref:phosphotransferase family protein n=1 Tax=Kitasatospora sp. NRRL B-11411 TaxID=1463822 RepID=UPI0004C2FDBA|nr:phosphotransferase [Kitasatospora sp. NRRL B-11411]